MFLPKKDFSGKKMSSDFKCDHSIMCRDNHIGPLDCWERHRHTAGPFHHPSGQESMGRRCGRISSRKVLASSTWFCNFKFSDTFIFWLQLGINYGKRKIWPRKHTNNIHKWMNVNQIKIYKNRLLRWFDESSRPMLAWLPFGAGPRICIGMRLAIMEQKLALVHLLKKYSIRKCPETEVWFIKRFVLVSILFHFQKELKIIGQGVFNPSSVTVKLERRQ
jgi:hypothetical protein